MNTKKSQKRVILAVDPFEAKLKPNRRSLTALKAWLNHMNASIDIVYVLSNAIGQKNLFDVSTIADHQLKQYADSLKLGARARSHLIIENSSSRKKAVRALIAYAKKQSADFIVLTSYGKEPIGRLVLGGFANILLAESPLPLLFLGSKKTSTFWSNRILFPTDFSPGSRLAFRKCLEQFKSLRPEITIFHVNTSSFLGYIGSSYSAYLPENYWQTRAANAMREGSLWVAEAKRTGYKARCIIDETSTSITKAIEREAKKQKAGLIALSSVSNRVRLRVFGSTAAQLFQLRNLPVWICGPEAIKAQFSEIEGKVPASMQEEASSTFDDLWI